MSEISDAFRRAKNHATRLGAHLRTAHDAVLAGDLDTAQKTMRVAERSHDFLTDSLGSLAEAIGEHDPSINPTAALGAQASDGQSPRGADAIVERLLAGFRRDARERRR